VKGGESLLTVFPNKTQQVIKGLGFEIQADSIGSGNHGLPEEPIGVPHDLVVAERERLAKEMLQGFRYCRLAGGLYWRGLDAEKKFMQPRWPEQLSELRDLLNTAGVEGVSFEYWSPAPYWKGNQSYTGLRPNDSANRLRCFAPGFADNPIYHGDTNAFLSDFAAATVADIQTLKAAGIKTSLWGLQNEPDVNHMIYSTCEYPDSTNYVRAYAAVAAAVRKFDTNIVLFADTENYFPRKIGSAMSRPEIAALVDAYAVHIVGSPSETPRKVHEDIKAKLPPRPWFQNEYEYLTGGATPDRCLNTVQHIMNSFQLAENPMWFWIHALKPVQNAEASGYSLGFWKSRLDTNQPPSAEKIRRWPSGPEFTQLPESLKSLEMVSVKPPAHGKPAIAYNFLVNQSVTVFLLADSRAVNKLSETWQKTDMTAAWPGGSDVIYRQIFPAGKIEIPAPGGAAAGYSVFLEPTNAATFKPQIGMNLPIQIRSQALAIEQKSRTVEPGHWIYNPYNWHAVGSFVRHLPWDSAVVAVEEKSYDVNARVLAFRRPDGKLTIVLSNRKLPPHTFQVATGLKGAVFKGYRFTPEEAGKNCRGIEIGTLAGGTISPRLETQSWEFWEQQ
jgi:hypothetical protein